MEKLLMENVFVTGYVLIGNKCVKKRNINW